MASSIETTSTTTTLKNNGNTYATVDTNDDVTITNDLAVSGDVGISTSAPVTKLHIEGGGTSLPATTGTTPSAGTTLRIRPGNNAILDIGGNSTSGAWLQSYDQTGMQTEYPLLLNPNGGNVGIGIAAPLAKNHTFGAGTAVVASGSDGRAEAIIEGANIPLTSSYGNLNIISNTSQAADTGGQIAFGGKHTDSNNAYGTWAVIKGAKENATSANIASYLAFSTRANGGGNTEKLRITSAGNVGIGIAAPTGKFAVSDGTTTGEINPTGGICWMGTRSNHDVAFQVNASEKMRITSGGSVLIGGTTAEPGRGNTTTGITLNPNGRIFQNASGSFSSLGRNDDGAIYVFTRGGTDVGNISVTSSATSYNTSSDYRLKENVEYDWDATTRLKQLKPARFNFLADPDNTVDGFMAHEAQEVVPEAVTGVKDEVDDDDKPVMQGIDQAKLVPLLVKTVQEQQTVIESLEARIAKLEENK